MPSSFKGLDLFGSGPHRFALGKQGQLALSGIALGAFIPDSTPLGLVELDITVTGRLVVGVAAGESALWTIRDAVVAQLLHPPTRGTLIDTRGRTWTDMSFIAYTEADRTDRGRTLSIGYTALFRRFIQPY